MPCVAFTRTRSLRADPGGAHPSTRGALTIFVALRRGTFGFMKNFGAEPAYRPPARGPEHNPAPRGVVSRIIAYSFVVAIGSGAAVYYSTGFPVAGCVTLF